MATEYGRVIYHDQKQKMFGKIMPDAGEPSIWFFTSDLANPSEIKTDTRVQFERLTYIQKGQNRVKAINVAIAPALTVVSPAANDELQILWPDSVIAARKARPKPPAPSAESAKKLVNVVVLPSELQDHL
jgi:hypothetical protein